MGLFIQQQTSQKELYIHLYSLPLIHIKRLASQFTTTFIVQEENLHSCSRLMYECGRGGTPELPKELFLSYFPCVDHPAVRKEDIKLSSVSIKYEILNIILTVQPTNRIL